MASLKTMQAGTAGKLERIKQLAAHGLNTPRVVQIESGTRFDDALRARLRNEARGDARMTVRTYHPTDEITYAKGPFHPEIPTEQAIRIAEELAPQWNILFQEAIDVGETLLAGNVLLGASGGGVYEALRGRYRVRDVEDPPIGARDSLVSGGFASPNEISVPEIRDLVDRVLASGLVDEVANDPDERFVVEFNVQEHPVGELGENLLLWEWRPLDRTPRSAANDEEVLEDGNVYGIGIRALPTPAGQSASRGALGGKGFGLARMHAIGLPVPPAAIFSVPPGRVSEQLPSEWRDELHEVVEALRDSASNRHVSVRSSPTTSMPGMLETVLDVPLDARDVANAMQVVLDSWRSERAISYRSNRGLRSPGLAIVVQVMVDGTAEGVSGAGVGFTRDPRTGRATPFVEWAARHRGDELVGGLITPADSAQLMRETEVWTQIVDAVPLLEAAFRDMQEFEFAVEGGRFFLLQSRSGKRTAAARVQIAYDLLKEGLVEQEDAQELLGRVDVNRLLQRRLARTDEAPVAAALVASPGAAAGRVAVSRNRALEFIAAGDPVVLCTETANPEDYPVVPRLAGLLTRRGGVTSHAAVVALEAGVVALVGCESAFVDTAARRLRFPDAEVAEGDWLSLDGSNGLVFRGKLDEVSPTLPEGLTSSALEWARSAQFRAAA